MHQDRLLLWYSYQLLLWMTYQPIILHHIYMDESNTFCFRKILHGAVWSGLRRLHKPISLQNQIFVENLRCFHHPSMRMNLDLGKIKMSKSLVFIFSIVISTTTFIPCAPLTSISFLADTNLTMTPARKVHHLAIQDQMTKFFLKV